jgi:hypothetical protein
MGIFDILKYKPAKFSRDTPAREAGGPIVKTGPTACQGRSKNADGQWRKKRSDAK